MQQIEQLDANSKASVFPKRFSNQIYLSDQSNLYFKYESVYSVKYMERGMEFYKTGTQLHELVEGAYLLVNNQQEVACIPSRQSGLAMSIFLEPDLVKDAVHVLSSDTTSLLDNPSYSSASEPTFFEWVYQNPKDTYRAYLKQLFWQLKGQQTTRKLSCEIDTFVGVAEQLLLAQQSISQQIHRIPAAKFATKTELFRRLMVAKDYIASHPTTVLALQDIAAIACLSPYHCHRMFRAVFRQTPLQYSRAIKIEEAKKWLQGEHHSITEIAYLLGYPDIAGFSKVFKKVTGWTPSSFRAKMVVDGKQ